MIKGFNGLRGLAVILVVLTHYGAYAAFAGSPWLVLVSGRTGVNAFFALSGFLITKLLIDEWERSGAVSIRNFYARRALRIFPLYFLFLAAVLLVALFVDGIIKRDSLVYALTYTYNFVSKKRYSMILGHTWSLAVEEHFFLVWPLAFAFLFPLRRRTLIKQAAGFVVLCWAMTVYLSFDNSLAERAFPGRWTIPAGSGIGLGALMALLLFGKERNARVIALCRHWMTPYLALALYLSSVALDGVYWGYQQQVVVISVTLLVGWIHFNQESRLVRFLELRPLAWVGLVSYGVYMWQGFLLTTGPERYPGQAWPPPPWVGLLLLFVFVPLSYYGFERPLLRIKNRYRDVRKQASVDDVAAVGAARDAAL